jgi:hypothetical protein
MREKNVNNASRSILSHVAMTIDGVRIGDSIY